MESVLRNPDLLAGPRDDSVAASDSVADRCVAVSAEGIGGDILASAVALSRRLNLRYHPFDHTVPNDLDFLLSVGRNGLSLKGTGVSDPGPIRVDFVGGATGFRRRAVGGRGQPLALAIGLRRGPVHVLDATAGLARDAFHLACLGCRVTAVERSPVLAALVEDGLARAAAGPREVRQAVDRMTLIAGDARDVLTALTGEGVPDVVYVDPMFPNKRKQALAKKEMRVCRRLVGCDEDAAELLEVARRVATRRVVVKRHPHDPPLAPRPSVQLTGKQARYDVYLC